MATRPIRVLLVSPLPPPIGGIATWTARVLRAPVAEDIERIHADTSVGAGHGASLTIHKAVRQIAVAAGVLWRIVRVRPDVIHVTTSYDRGWNRDMLFLSVARAVGSATILNFRGGDFDRMYRDAAPAAQRKIRDQLARCDAIVAITTESERFLKTLDLSNVTVIPNCIDVANVPTRRARSASLRWLFVGNVIKAKGVTELFDALRRFPGAHLTLVGPSPGGIADEGAALVTRATMDPALNGRITHIDGMSPDRAREVYPNHDIFVFPTRREGFPNAVLEAMEAGLPIVATRVGAIPDMITDGEHGLLVDAGDQRALERAIARITEDTELAERLGRHARERVMSEYEIGHVVSMWSDLYRRVSASTGAATAD